MRRHGVLRYVDEAGELTGRDAVGFVPDKKAEGLQSRGLCQGVERRNCCVVIHISRLSDILRLSIAGGD